MGIYRRGAIYWWRRNLRCFAAETHPITIRLSLRTACARTAKTRAAGLELEWNTVQTVVDADLRPDLAREDLNRIYHLAYKTQLDRIIVKQAATPMLEEGHAAANLIYARIFTLLARCPTSPVPDEEFLEWLRDAGLTQKESEDLHMTMQLHRQDLPISHRQIGTYLRDAGVHPNDRNLKAVGRIVAGAYRNACIEASSLLGRPIAPGTVWPLPGNLLGLLGIDAPIHDKPVDVAQSSTEATPTPVFRAQREQPVSAAPGDVPISELAALAVANKVASGEWDEERKRDIDAIVTLFIAAVGNIPFGSITQQHLAETMDLLPRLPSRYGFARKDRTTGEWTQETIAEALRRGDSLKAQWSIDPVAAERAKIGTVGLGPVTQKKHLTWLKALVTFAEATGRPYPRDLNFSILRRRAGKAAKNERIGRTSPGKKKNAALSAWATEDLRHLFTAPLWTGCADLWDRFSPGDLIIHDAWYWSPLVIALTGCRSDEGNGLAIDDVVTDAAVPYMHFRVNAFRRLKTAASDRKVPIHPLLIELGFLDYVAAMKGGRPSAAVSGIVQSQVGL